jgi:predicted neutral ceramidase superfamily lipid hydrolase
MKVNTMTKLTNKESRLLFYKEFNSYFLPRISSMMKIGYIAALLYGICTDNLALAALVLLINLLLTSAILWCNKDIKATALPIIKNSGFLMSLIVSVITFLIACPFILFDFLETVATKFIGLNTNIVFKNRPKLIQAFSKDEILSTLKRRPLTKEDIENLFDENSKNELQILVNENIIKIIDSAGVEFYKYL